MFSSNKIKSCTPIRAIAKWCNNWTFKRLVYFIATWLPTYHEISTIKRYVSLQQGLNFNCALRAQAKINCNTNGNTSVYIIMLPRYGYQVLANLMACQIKSLKNTINKVFLYWGRTMGLDGGARQSPSSPLWKLRALRPHKPPSWGLAAHRPPHINIF
jgi:hypothetical protein